MKKTIITIAIILLTTNLAMAQKISCPHILLNKTESASTYLTAVYKGENHTFYTETGDADINLGYELEIEYHNGLHRTLQPMTAQFVPDGDRYRIMETSGGSTHLEREFANSRITSYVDKNGKKVKIEESSPWQEGMRETPPSGIPHFVGYSDNDSLPAVKALKYWNEHAPKYKVYESDQVDEQPKFMRGSEQLDVAEYVKDEVTKLLQQKADSLSGTVSFGYVVRENSWVVDIVVESINLKPATLIPTACSYANGAILKYVNYRDQVHQWVSGTLDGKPVAVRQRVEVVF